MANNRPKQRGTDMFMYFGNPLLPVACDKTCTIEATTKTVDSTSKCDVDENNVLWTGTVAISNGWKVSGSGLTVLPNYDSSGGEIITSNDMFQIYRLQTPVFVTYKNKTTGALECGYGVLTSIKETSPAEDLSTFDWEVTGNGPLKTQQF